MRHLPTLLTIAGIALLLWFGPIAQPPHFNDFADQSVWMGIPHAADVLSNLGFAIVAVWGWRRLRPAPARAALRAGELGYRLFLVGLLLTAVGSAYYHWAPDNQRLVWDRLPIAVSFAGLLAAVRAEMRPDTAALRFAVVMSVLAALSVAWWHYTDHPQQPGDLGPYVLLQALPLLLIPLWQAIYGAPRRDRLNFAVVIGCFLLAKWAELNELTLLATLGWISGHTLKHLLATLAAGLLVGRLVQRSRAQCAL